MKGSTASARCALHPRERQHERRIVGLPVLQQIDVYCEISASKPLVIEVVPG
jgi:hypothetical protein